MEHIGKVIKEKRKKMKMTQDELGSRVDACYISIGHLEQGKNVGTKLLEKVCNELELEISVKDKE